jgi:dienelactone hydrolase
MSSSSGATAAGMGVATASGRPSPSRDEVVTRLRAYSRLEEPEAGRREEQRFIHTEQGRLFLTLVEPLGPRRPVGFLVCHSFAFEQFELYPLELTFARLAASAGFPAVYVQARGYGDSGGPFEEVTFDTHVRDALAAVDHARREGTLDAVAPVGTRFGALVALAVAGELRAPGVALWDPPGDPGRYLDGLLRAFVRSGVLDQGLGRPRRTTEQLREALREGETVDLFGYPLTPHSYAEIRSATPLSRLRGPAPRALAVVVNPSHRSGAESLAERLRAGGSDVRVEEAEGPGRGQFGLGVPVGGHLATNLPTFEDVARRTIGWAGEVW